MCCARRPAVAGDTDMSDASALAHAARGGAICRAAEVATCFIGAADVGRTIRVGGAMWLARSDAANSGAFAVAAGPAPPLRREAAKPAADTHDIPGAAGADARRGRDVGAVVGREAHAHAVGWWPPPSPTPHRPAVSAAAEPWRAAKALPGRGAAIPVCERSDAGPRTAIVTRS